MIKKLAPRNNSLRLTLFLLAIGFYTRLPTPKRLDYSELPKASLYLPVVGWIVGGVSAASYYAASWVWSPTVAIILALIAGIVLTGAFHEDGFADVCDGFGGGYDKQHILDIMKDSAIGVYGALGLILILALKISALVALPKATVSLVLLAGHSISRFQPLMLMYRYDYARTGAAKGGLAAYRPSGRELSVAGIAALLPLLLLPPYCIVAIPVMMFITWRLGVFFHRHIGGYTGDCLGASQQVSETIFYLCSGVAWTFT